MPSATPANQRRRGGLSECAGGGRAGPRATVRWQAGAGIEGPLAPRRTLTLGGLSSPHGEDTLTLTRLGEADSPGRGTAGSTSRFSGPRVDDKLATFVSTDTPTTRLKGTVSRGVKKVL
ncbi:hypothetical protein SKAU_G00223810 [Synaphobranchus kaupii]|uniref:Uncharacterized protein n=1 Tax=Synaphobranchus kaupii TaxID=118154 RepID=A0A9Q1IVR7_SYNKA|nr:hypothetical protein SKAU_G00223810 [Synaphobranchus kaupii]